jgi:hypothetical protein
MMCLCIAVDGVDRCIGAVLGLGDDTNHNSNDTKVGHALLKPIEEMIST